MEETPSPTRAGRDEEASELRVEDLLPVPTAPPEPRPRRESLWRRITARRSVQRAHALSSEDPEEAIRNRLETIEGQLEALEDAQAARFDALEARFNRLWEIEDQLDRLLEMREAVEAMERAQQETAHAAGALRRGVGWLAALVLAVGAALLSTIAVQ